MPYACGVENRWDGCRGLPFGRENTLVAVETRYSCTFLGVFVLVLGLNLEGALGSRHSIGPGVGVNKQELVVREGTLIELQPKPACC